MDGYALNSTDIRGASKASPVWLSVVDEARAGFQAGRGVTPGTTVKVMTGAVVPEGADVVLRSEDVDVCQDKIIVKKSFAPGTHLVMPGEDVAKGELIARQGALLTPPLIGLLAGLGLVRLPVFRNVTVAVMSTGDELIDPGESQSPGKIFNSSLYGIMARCQEAGVMPLQLGIVSDEVGCVAEKMAEEAAEASRI